MTNQHCSVMDYLKQERLLSAVQMDGLTGLYIPEDKRAGYSKTELKAFIDASKTVESIVPRFSYT